MKHLTLLLVFSLGIVSCKKKDDETTPSTQPSTDTTTMYFPSNTGVNWESLSFVSLGWNANAVQPLKDFLIDKNTKSFMILVNGRIVMEEYFNGHTANTDWKWNSAGKTLVTTTVGIAEQNGLLNINNKVSDYIGTAWTSAPIEKENLITSKHLLTMTSGLNDSNNFTNPQSLSYIADAGTRWSYHSVFQKLMDVVAASSTQTFEAYFNTHLKNKIGMDGYWNNGLFAEIYHSTTRSMARFGILALNKGKWNNEQIINETFFNQSISTSQNINPSYGYMWWLNGKTSFMVPGEQTVYQGPFAPNAPADMYAAMGANDQRIYVIPSKNMIVVRMGNSADPANPSFAVSGFDYQLWEKINLLIEN